MTDRTPSDPDPMPGRHWARLADPRPARWPIIVIVVAVFLVYGRLLAANFTWWDDQMTLHGNPAMNPPTLETLRHHWTSFEQGLYVPVTWTVWALLARLANVAEADPDYPIFLNPALFHGASLLVHLASSLLAYRILRRLVPDTTACLLGTLLFALHPIQVETVGWVSGLKDLLCWLGALGVTLLYVRRVQAVMASGRPLWASWEMPLAMLLLILAILSKPTAMVTPAALVVIDGLMLRRRWIPSIIELLPLFAVSACGAVVARLAQGVATVPKLSLWQRPFLVGETVTFYLGKIVWPATLTMDYGKQPLVMARQASFYIAWLIPAALAAALFAWRRRVPVLAAAGCLLLIGIAPVSGVAVFQMQQISTVTDHYFYFSMLGPALALAWVLSRWPQTGLRVAASVLVAVLAVRSFVQTAIWHDTITLFTHALHAHPRSSVARNNLAMSYLGMHLSRPDLAEPIIDEAEQIDPESYYVMMNYGTIKARLRKLPEARRGYESAWTTARRLGAPPSELSKLAASVAYAFLQANDLETASNWADRAMATDSGQYQARAAQVAVQQAKQKRAATIPATGTLPPTVAAPATGPATSVPSPAPASRPAG